MKGYLKSLVTGEGLTQLVKVAIICVFNTVVHFSILNVLFLVYSWSGNGSTAVAFTTATLSSYFLNRHWTFAIKHGKGLVRESLVFFGVNLISLAVTLGIVQLVDVWFGPLNGPLLNLANIAAAGIVVLPKFASYRDLVFTKSRAIQAQRVEAAADETAGSR